jgi:hypothetical protein
VVLTYIPDCHLVANHRNLPMVPLSISKLFMRDE